MPCRDVCLDSDRLEAAQIVGVHARDYRTIGTRREESRGDKPKEVASNMRRPKGAEMPKKATRAAATEAGCTEDDHATTKKTETIELDREHVATRAYYIHLAEGGDTTENWLRAERELVAA